MSGDDHRLDHKDASYSSFGNEDELLSNRKLKKVPVDDQGFPLDSYFCGPSIVQD